MSAARKPTSRRSSASRSARKKSAAKTRSTTTGKAARKSASGKKTAKKAAAGETAKKKSAARKTAKKTSARRGSTTTASQNKKTTAGGAGARGAARTRAKRPAPARSASRARPAKLDRRALDKIRADLRDERAAYEAQMSDLEEQSFRGTQSELTGEVGIDEDFADAGSATFDREQALSIHNNIRDLIEQVDRALARIEDGTYGACERCGRPIDAARLKALPRTLLCTDCKRREERAR